MTSCGVFTVVDASHWPEVDSQPLSLEDSWRLRVVSAQVYSIMKNRDVEHFERVIGFLDSTYRLLPRLVPSIKHMKIIFGLKTMVWKWVVVALTHSLTHSLNKHVKIFLGNALVLFICCSCSVAVLFLMFICIL